jgi:hypothetical protein
MLELALWMLFAQALLGAFDTIWHHELTVALPRCATARMELALHSARALLYGLVFAGLASSSTRSLPITPTAKKNTKFTTQ